MIALLLLGAGIDDLKIAWKPREAPRVAIGTGLPWTSPWSGRATRPLKLSRGPAPDGAPAQKAMGARRAFAPAGRRSMLKGRQPFRRLIRFALPQGCL
ncbi:MAG: hypothetical protein CFK52_11675 [Chloracidobacterium sp. CP2_5A]|nr:MAG: hypothetical protein CFK52_11675 [Chloracidobacterium sp. CP2_5A]